MILYVSDSKLNTKTKIYLECDKCGKEQRRPYQKYIHLVDNIEEFDMDYCESCWNSIRQNTVKAKENMSNALNKMILKDPAWKIRNSESKKGIINLAESNGMKQLEACKKVSKARIEMYKDPKQREITAQHVAKAWADGKYENVKVGKSKWFDYIHSDGTIYKVQGTWELKFIEWLDSNKMEFKCHKGRLPYILEPNGIERNYYPDFWVEDWNCWVDIKNKYHYLLQKDKFKAIENTGHKVRLIFKEELEKLTNSKI